jgi:hypothetical protein
MNFPAAGHAVSMNDTFHPNPDKPELKQEFSIQNICIWLKLKYLLKSLVRFLL